jgi:hypothetical protein
MFGTLLGSESAEITEKRIQKRVDDHMKCLEVQAGKPLAEMGVEYLENLLRNMAALLYIEKRKHEITATWQTGAFILISRLEEAEKKRIESRPVNVLKRAFKKAVEANMDAYNTIAEAVRDLRSKPQFENIPETTLRSWAREDWIKPTKVGRPRKSAP